MRDARKKGSENTRKKEREKGEGNPKRKLLRTRKDISRNQRRAKERKGKKGREKWRKKEKGARGECEYE